MNKKLNNFLLGFSLAVVIVAVAVISLFVYNLTGEFQGGIEPFSVQVNGNLVSYSDCNVTTCVEEPITVKVNYIKSNPTKVNYKARIVSRVVPENDFNLTVNGEVMKFSEITAEMTNGFIISPVNNSTFTVAPKGNLTEVISAVFGGAEVNDINSLAYQDMFALIIETYDGEKTAPVWFSILLPVEGISLPERILF